MTEPMDDRRKRLRFRAWHRGTRELDFLMGSFADRHLADLDDEELEAFEALLNENDVETFSWIAGQKTPPEQHAALIARLQALDLTPDDYN